MKISAAKMQRMQSPPLVVVLFLLLVCCTYGCLADSLYRCKFDDMMGKSGMESLAVVKEIPRKGQGTMQAYTLSVSGEDKKWEPIRIVVSSEDLENSERYCTAENDVRPTFLGRNDTCRDYDVLTIPIKNELLQKTIPTAIKLHGERLLVQPQSTALIVPESIEGTRCQYFTVPEDHKTSGVPNADVVLYVATGPSTTFSVSCALGADNRPIVGAMNFRLADFTHATFPSRVAAHEIAHALGFNHQMMSSLNMIDRVTGVRGKTKEVMIVKSEKTKAAAQKHYNCESVEGMELEDEESGNNIPPHWERRNAKDELMSPVVGAGFYTALTLSAFEDMKFYRANYSMAEQMEWGNKAGCAFLQDKCIKGGITEFPNMFCNDTRGSSEQYCTSDRLSLGDCGISRSHSNLPDYYTYFEQANIAGQSHSLTDFCPVIVPNPFGMCSSEEEGFIFRGSRLGRGSWCLDGESLKVHGEGAISASQSVSVGGVCAEVLCVDKSVKVRYLGDEEWHNCPEGGYLEPASTAPGVFASGKIKCPKFNEVCTIAPSGKSIVTPIEQKSPELDVKEKEPVPGDEMGNKEQSGTSTTPSKPSSVPPSTSENSSGNQGGIPKNDPTSAQGLRDGSEATFIGVPIGLIAMATAVVMSF